MRRLRILAAALALMSATIPVGVTPAGATDVTDVIDLPRPTLSIVAVDLDGDGSREVVRLAAAPSQPLDPILDLVAEAWGSSQGEWRLLGSKALLRPADDGSGVVPVENDDPAALLVWRRDGVEHALVVTRPLPSSDGRSTATAGEVRLTSGGLDLLPLPGLAGAWEALHALDMDDDGTDELIGSGPVVGLGPPAVTLYRWEGREFSSEQVQLGDVEVPSWGLAPEILPSSSVGDTDGIAGEEALFPLGDGLSHSRIYLDEQGVARSEMLVWDDVPAYRSALHVGRGILVRFESPSFSVVTQWRWPRGGDPQLVRRFQLGLHSAGWLLNAGEASVLVEVQEALFLQGPYIRVHSFDGEPPVEVEHDPAAVDLLELVHNRSPALSRFPEVGIGPQFGVVPPGAGQSGALVALGRLVAVDTAGQVTVDPVPVRSGRLPVAFAGADDEWAILSEGDWSLRRAAYLHTGGTRDRGARLVPASLLLSPAAEPAARITTEAPTGEWNGRDRIYAGADGLAVSIEAPPGSVVVGAMNSSIVFEQRIPGSRAVTLAPTRPAVENSSHRTALVVLDPTGAATVKEWDVMLLREPPTVAAEVETRFGQLSAVVRGGASEHASVFVDGERVEVDAAGRFSTTVDAVPWPRDVRVIARDPLGFEAVALVSVVGLVDYRGLPWPWLAAAVPLGASLWLALRVPRPRRLVPTDDQLGDAEAAPAILDDPDVLEALRTTVR